jgi:PAS domain S-box-containing protein
MQAPLSIHITEIPDAVLLVGQDGSIVGANAPAEQMFGYGRNELDGSALALLIPEGYRERHARVVRGYFAEPKTLPMGIGRELQGLRRDGVEFPVEIALGPIVGNSLAVAVIRDISASVQLRNDMRKSEQLFRIGALHSSDVVYSLNIKEGSIDFFGDIDSLLGYEPGEVPRTLSGWNALIHPDDLDRVISYRRSVIESGEKSWSVRYRTRTKDGSYRHFRFAGSVTEFIDGRPVRGVVALVDETERVLSRQKLETALAEVEALRDRLQAESQYFQQEIKSEHNFDNIIGNSGPMRATLLKVEKVAPTDTTVLVLGETGTGKELLARAIQSRSHRRDRPLIKIDCGAISAGLIESELFGHEKGAFTGATEKKQGRFELAHGGTVFLDEIGELPLDLQTKLLRVIEDGVIKPVGSEREKRVDVRIIAATNRNLKDEVQKGRFRGDLYYRVSVFLVESPPLRDRREDIPLLAAFFVSGFSTDLGKNIRAIEQTSMDRLAAYDWPGNIRELRNVLERAVILSEGATLEVESLGTVERPDHTLKADLHAVERARILRALEESGWKIKGESNAASRLGLKPSTLRARMKMLGIERPKPIDGFDETRTPRL